MQLEPHRLPSRAIASAVLLLAITLLAAIPLMRSLTRADRPVGGGPTGLLTSPRAGGIPAPEQTSHPPTAAAPDTSVTYTVEAGDTLGGIAAKFGLSIEALMAINDLTDPDALQIGQELRLRIVPDHAGPDIRVIPDSELVRGPASLDFDAQAFLANQAGRLASHEELVDGETMTGPEILDRVSREFSVNPRLLLAFVEARSGWVTGAPADPAAADFPAGLVDPARAGLWLQLNWLADRLNGGYYDWKTRDNRVITLRDGVYLAGYEKLNPASFAVQRALGFQSTEAELAERLAAFDAAYRHLFGDPWARERPVPAQAEIAFPPLAIPWAKAERWWMTGGPHGGWGNGSAWAALDFVPDGEARGCFVAPNWATAVADGVIVAGVTGEVWLDLDGDGRRETGPAVQYLHLAEEGRAAPGTHVKAGDPIGHPSCEGGISEATHLHISRMQDGEWLAAAGPSAFALGDWTATGAGVVYDGGLLHADGRERTACECRLDGENDVAW